VIHRWSARDVLVLKAVTLTLGELLSPGIDARCYHVAGRGGLKGAVRAVRDAAASARFVARSDVSSYYDSIDHGLLRALVPDSTVIMLVERYLEHLVDRHGLLMLVKRGISAGCPLSPLLGTVYLRELDEVMARLHERDGTFYARYMDDWVILAPTRWKLRRAVAAMNEVLCGLKLRKHPDKTFIGRVERGFDFLGYRFGDVVDQSAPAVAPGVGVARQTIARFEEHVARLYEQGASDARIGQYVRRWCRWLLGLADLNSTTLAWDGGPVMPGRCTSAFSVYLAVRHLGGGDYV